MSLRESIKYRIGFRSFTFLSIAVGAVAGLVYYFSVPKQYDSAVVLLPEASNTNVSVTRLKSMAALFRSNLDFSSDALKPLFYADIILSTPFLEEILDTRVSTLDGSVNVSLREYLLDYSEETWWTSVLKFPKKIKDAFKDADARNWNREFDKVILTENEMELIKDFSANIVADVSYITRRTIVRVRTQDPLVSYQVCSAIVKNLQKHIQQYRTAKNTENYKFIGAMCQQEQQRLLQDRMEYARTFDNNMDISTSQGRIDLIQKEEQMRMDMAIYTQMYIQCKLARLNAYSNVPAFRIVQPPLVVLRTAEPRVFVSMLRFSLLFMFAFIVFYFVRRPWE